MGEVQIINEGLIQLWGPSVVHAGKLVTQWDTGTEQNHRWLYWIFHVDV